MQFKEIDVLPPIDLALKKLLPEGENILYNYPLFILEKEIEDHLLSEIFLTENYLILHYDFKLEFYELSKLEIYAFGDEPKFTLWTQLIEQSYSHTREDDKWFKDLCANESFYRILFNEIGEKPKTIVLRERDFTAKSYKSWALFQALVNHKSKTVQDPLLKEMTAGNFTKFNEKTILTFIGAALGLILISMLVSTLLPDIANTIFMYVFGIFCVLALVWTIMSIEKNNKRFFAAYLRYNPQKNQPAQQKMIKKEELVAKTRIENEEMVKGPQSAEQKPNDYPVPVQNIQTSNLSTPNPTESSQDPQLPTPPIIVQSDKTI